jgi:hypothetical protein
MSSASRKHCKKGGFAWTIDPLRLGRSAVRPSLLNRRGRLEQSSTPLVSSPLPSRSSMGCRASTFGLFPMIFGNRVFASQCPGIRLPAPVVWRGLQHCVPQRMLGTVSAWCKTCSARISCVRALFSCCGGILEMALDQRPGAGGERPSPQVHATRAQNPQQNSTSPFEASSPRSRGASPRLVNAHPGHFGLLVELPRFTRMTCERIEAPKLAAARSVREPRAVMMDRPPLQASVR